jgi:hypothetical protein
VAEDVATVVVVAAAGVATAVSAVAVAVDAAGIVETAAIAETAGNSLLRFSPPQCFAPSAHALEAL